MTALNRININMKLIIVLILIATPFFNSLAQESTEGMTQMQRVVKVHDTIMEKEMGKIIYYIGQLETKSKADNSSTEYDKAIEDLKLANKAMVDWMHGFGNRFDADEMYKGKPLTSQKKEWLKEEEIKLLEMKEQLESSIKAAQLLLDDKK